MAEYAVDDLAIVDERDDAQLAATAQTPQWLDLVDATEKSGPGSRAGRRHGRRRIDGDRGDLLVPAASRAAHDRVSAEVTDRVQPRRGHMDEDTSQELERIEALPVGVGGVPVVAVPWAVLDHAGLGVEGQALEANRRPQRFDKLTALSLSKGR